MADPSTENLTRGTLRGLGWVYGGTALGAGIQLAYTAVMGRLLTPRDFGLLAMALVFERFGTYFARMGVSQALVQKAALDDEDVRVAITASVLLGLVFGGAVAATAPIAGLFFETDAVVPLIRVLALAFLLGSFSHVSTSLLRRVLRFRALAGIEVASHGIAFLIVGIGMALLGFGVWSLVGARLTHGLLQAVLAYCATRHALAPLVDWGRVRALFGYGSRVSVIEFLEFLTASMDTLLIGRFAGTQRLGHYNRAFMLVKLPFEQIVSGFTRVLFPSFSRIQDQRDRLCGAYRSAYGILAGILFPIAAGLAVAAPEVVRVVIGAQWTLAAGVLPVLAAAAAVNFLSHIGGVVCDATATLNPKFALQLTHLALISALLFAATMQNTLLAYAGAVLVAELVRHLLYMLLMGRVLGFGLRAHLRLQGPIMLGAGLVAVSVAGVTLMLRPVLPVAGVFGAQVAAGAVALGFGLWWGPLVGIRRDATEHLKVAGVLAGDGLLARIARGLLSQGR